MQLTLFDDGNQEGRAADTSSTFQKNLSLPIHRWYRYSAGFSAAWVGEVLERAKAEGRKTVLDPFVGSGTVLLAGELCQLKATGLESHPFISRVARAKLAWRERPEAFREYALQVLSEAERQQALPGEYPKLIQTCFPPEALLQLDRLRRAWVDKADGSGLSELAWLTLASILRECSPVGTAQWQYVLPKKNKLRTAAPFQAFRAKVGLMAEDMAWRQQRALGPKAQVIWEDARRPTSVKAGWADLVVTSPPYANNYDYADAARLEMSFFGDINGWGCLQETVRRYLVRSCSQHVAPIHKQTGALLADALLAPIRDEIHEVCRKLDAERENHGGKKTYHTMVAAYFLDMAEVWASLRRVCRDGAEVCFVVGDSAPYGIHVPVDRWLGELAVAAGFKSFSFEKTRDRNTKWKNRKHRVPLHEGRLWVKG